MTSICPICGHEFYSERHWHKKFCSLSCKRNAQKKRRRAFGVPAAQRRRETLADIENFDGFKPRKTRTELLKEI